MRLKPDDSAQKPRYLNNLGLSLLGRFERSRDVADLTKAISAHEQSVSMTPDAHADQSGRLSNLGNTFHWRFLRGILLILTRLSRPTSVLYISYSR